MCTLSWRLDGSTLDVFFNRDEQKSRVAARPAHFWPDYEAIFPVDPQGGGTWLAATTSGCVFALLNNYQATVKDSDICVEREIPLLSRGLVITMLLQEMGALKPFESQSKPADLQPFTIEHCLKCLPLFAFKPFTLVCLSPSWQAFAFDWDGFQLTTTRPRSPVISSAVALRSVQAYRLSVYPEGEATVGHLMQFHSSHEPSASAFSVCMHRDDAHTVSFSHVQVTLQNISFQYFAGSPCQRLVGHQDTQISLGITVPR